MNKTITWGLVIVVLAAAVYFLGFANNTTSSVVMNMTSKGYSPQNITIKQGESIVFRNNDSEDLWPASNIHPTHEIYSEFDPKKPVPAGQSWTFQFNKKGVWRYHDHLYPGVTGSITVQ